MMFRRQRYLKESRGFDRGGRRRLGWLMPTLLLLFLIAGVAWLGLQLLGGEGTAGAGGSRYEVLPLGPPGP
ncbi:MAG: hypothetical protein HQL82_07865 [Magnetococcales bacterium]|nr:hypothetical protein [Magnetococcales bacterium]